MPYALGFVRAQWLECMADAIMLYALGHVEGMIHAQLEAA